MLCLVERDKGWFQFDVQSLREYFTATYIFDQGKRDARDGYFTTMLRRPYWSNVCRFYVGKYSPAEVRDIRHLLQELSKEPDLGLHPMLRSTAALFLNDRTYERQKDAPVQEIVDFILDGPGVVLAEDGLLAGSGSALLLSERAGRDQAVDHLKRRLVTETDAGIRAALVSSLRLHAASGDSLAGWWWAAHQQSWNWLQAASQLGVLGDLTRQRETQLAELLSAVASDSDWATRLLLAGGYRGSADEVLSVVQAEINDGAGESLRGVDRSTPVGRLLHGAAVALSRAAGETPRKGASRTRLRGTKTASLLAPVVAATAEFGDRLGHDATTDQWSTRLTRIAEVWGDGWVLHQAVVALPLAVDLGTIAKATGARQPALYAALMTEAQARANRNNSDWWWQQLSSASTPLARRHWLFSVLSCPYAQVVVDLADEIDGVVGELAPKYYGAIRAALRHFRTSGGSHEMLLFDALRLNRVTFSPRTLWLLRVVSTQASVEQIDRRLADAYPDLLASGLGDLRELTRVVGDSKTIPFNAFRGHRAALPVGGWASNIKLGAMRGKVAGAVLANPAAWPGDLVQRAVEKVEERMSADLRPIAEVAEDHGWFGEE